MNLTIEKVTDKNGLKSFVRFPNELYKSNPYYVPQLESMDLTTFDRNKNHAFEVCSAEYYLARNEKGKVVGRVAAIINRAYNAKTGKKICRFGWIDFIEDPDVPRALLNQVEEYARENGMEEIVGPEGLLEFDVAGVLVEGFDKLPTAYGKYNAPYYEKMITDLGYVKAVDWVEYLIDLTYDKVEKYKRAAELASERYDVHQAPLKCRKDILKYYKGMFSVMNECYKDIYGYTQLSDGQIQDLMDSFYPNYDTGLVSVILDKDERVVAFCIWMPSLSKALQKAKGHLFPFGFIHLLRALRRNDTVDTLLIGILPEYQNKGMNAMFFDKMAPRLKKIGVRYLDTTRELESNTSVQNLATKYDRQLVKRARAYQKSLL